jgi:hypothetical protein
MVKYKYKIKGADPINSTLIVEYIPESASLDSFTMNITAPSVSETDLNKYINIYAPFDIWKLQASPRTDLLQYIGREANIDPSLYIETAKDPYELIKEEYDKMEQDFLNEGNV